MISGSMGLDAGDSSKFFKREYQLFLKPKKKKEYQFFLFFIYQIRMVAKFRMFFRQVICFASESFFNPLNFLCPS
jgi:hypothetical protein